MINILTNKGLRFFEKDGNTKNTEECIENAKFFLDKFLKLPKEQIDSMVIFLEFNKMNSDELAKIMYNPANIIVTYSVYSQGSDILFNRYMASVGRNNIKGLTYIDATGLLGAYLNRSLMYFEENPYDIICGINSNNIISINYNEKTPTPKLLTVQINGRYEDCVVYKDLTNENSKIFC